MFVFIVPLCVRACVLCARGEERWHGSKGEIGSSSELGFEARGTWLSCGKEDWELPPPAPSFRALGQTTERLDCVFLGLGGWMG